MAWSRPSCAGRWIRSLAISMSPRSRSACWPRPRSWRRWPTASQAWRPPLVVLDPVMVAKGGDRLLRDEAVAALRERLLPLAHLITPNLPEAGALLRRSRSPATARHGGGGGAAARPRARPTSCSRAAIWPAPRAPTSCCPAASGSGSRRPRIATRHTHGTGCTLSSAIAALLARGLPAARRRRRGQALADRGDRRGRWSRHRPRYRAGSPFPCPVADPRRGRSGCLTRRPA